MRLTRWRPCEPRPNSETSAGTEGTAAEGACPGSGLREARRTAAPCGRRNAAGATVAPAVVAAVGTGAAGLGTGQRRARAESGCGCCCCWTCWRPASPAGGRRPEPRSSSSWWTGGPCPCCCTGWREEEELGGC